MLTILSKLDPRCIVAISVFCRRRLYSPPRCRSLMPLRLEYVIRCAFRTHQEKSVLEKRQKKEERKRRKAAAKAAAGARAGGQQDEESSRVQRPARKSISDWRGKFAMGAAGLGIGSAGGGGGGVSRGASSRSSPGDVSSLVSNEKVVVQKREAYGDKFYRQVITFGFYCFFSSNSEFGLFFSLKSRCSLYFSLNIIYIFFVLNCFFLRAT